MVSICCLMRFSIFVPLGLCRCIRFQVLLIIFKEFSWEFLFLLTFAITRLRLICIFASITSFQYHPANPAAQRLTLDECATIAVQMMQVRAEVFAPLESVSAPPLGPHFFEEV